MNAVLVAARNQFQPQSHLLTSEHFTQAPILFYVIHIENIAKSRLSRLDEWEEQGDPEKRSVDRMKARVIRLVNVEDDNGSAPVAAADTYKLTLRDSFDNYCFAYEYNDKLPFLRTGPGYPSDALGARILVNKGTLVMNGVLMLHRATCQNLGVDPGDRSLADRLQGDLAEKNIAVLRAELGKPAV